MKNVLCFAYGSNLSSKDRNEFYHRNKRKEGDFLGASLGEAVLKDYKLTFPRKSIGRNGGILSIEESKGDIVIGVVFEVTDPGLLDIKEGLGFTYDKVTLSVDLEGTSTEVYTYVARKTCDFFAPSSRYLEICLEGRREHNLETASLLKAARINL